MIEFICEIGREFYQQGRYDDAYLEFQKAVLIDPSYAPAQAYIQKIERKLGQEGEVSEAGREQLSVPAISVSASDRQRAQMRRVLDQFEPKSAVPAVSTAAPSGQRYSQKQPSAEKKLYTLPVIRLDSALSNAAGPVVIEQDREGIVQGSSIDRFLITEPGIISIEKRDPNTLLVRGVSLGTTFVHVWDARGRWTFECTVIPAQPVGDSLEATQRRAEEHAENFKLFYTVDWSTLRLGRGLETLERSTYSYEHSFGLLGPTPYGQLDAASAIVRFPGKTEMQSLSVGLTDGRFGPFEGFTLRGFDIFQFPPRFSNAMFPGNALRGGMVSSPAFHNRITYTLFYGREEPVGRGFFSPTLSGKRKEYLEGANVEIALPKQQKTSLTFVHGFGKERSDDLNANGYDIIHQWRTGPMRWSYEVAYDSDTTANLLKTEYLQKTFSLSSEWRDINKKFVNMTGNGWRQGERGMTMSAYYLPWDALDLRANIDAYQDRLFPASDNDNRWNQDFNGEVGYRIDPLTVARLGYTLQNDLGRLSQSRYQMPSLAIYRTVKWFKDVLFSLNLAHQRNQNFSAPSLDYRNERAIAGMRVNVLGDLYWFVNREYNWLTEVSTGAFSQPNAVETGLDLSSRIGNSPWYRTLRCTYRNEEDTVSTLSFLSGEDYVEGFSELSYRPDNDLTIYLNCRVRNVWAENPQVSKRVEASVNAGLRYFWNTGVRWEASGTIEGHVFKDENNDGIRQEHESGSENVKIWIGKSRQQMTDAQGHYIFRNVTGKKAFVTLDSATLPSGYILTVPITQEVEIVPQRRIRADFGITVRSEITGLVFIDEDHNGVYDQGDTPVRKAVLFLEDSTKSNTDWTGRYSFPKISAGEHTVTLDINSLPLDYLPAVPLTKTIQLQEGSTFYYNIPVKRSRP